MALCKYDVIYVKSIDITVVKCTKRVKKNTPNLCAVLLNNFKATGAQKLGSIGESLIKHLA